MVLGGLSASPPRMHCCKGWGWVYGLKVRVYGLGYGSRAQGGTLSVCVASSNALLQKMR